MIKYQHKEICILCFAGKRKIKRKRGTTFRKEVQPLIQTGFY